MKYLATLYDDDCNILFAKEIDCSSYDLALDAIAIVMQREARLKRMRPVAIYDANGRRVME